MKWFWSLTPWVFVSLLAYVLCIVFEQKMPALVRTGGEYSSLFLTISWTATVLFAAGAVLSTRRYLMSGDALMAYVAICQIAFAGTNLMFFIGGTRYGLAWYLARFLSAGGTLVVFVGLLVDYLRLYSRERTEREKLNTVFKVVEEQRASLQAILASLPVGVWVSDAGGKITMVNDAAASIYGGKAPKVETFEEYSVYKVWRPDTGERVAVEDYPLPRALRGEVVRDMILDHERFDGSWGTHSASSTPIRDPHGKVIGAVVAALDITGLKRAEAVLLRERDILQSVMNGAGSTHLAYLDRDFNFVRVNETYATGCGYRPEEMIGLNHFDLYPHEENEAIFKRVRDTGIPAVYHDKPFLFPNQPERGITYWDWTLMPMADARGKVEGLVFSLVETTARKRAEEALRESENRLRFAVENSPDNIFIQDRDLRYVWVGRAAYPLSREEYIGRTDLDLAPPEDAMKLMEIKGRVLQEGRPLSVELPLTLKGQYRIFEATYTPWPDADGSTIGLAGYVRDITERKQIEEELRRSHDRLELRVQERTAELERKNRELQDFAFIAAHDLNEPLRKIQTFGSLLEAKSADRLDQQQRDYISRITGSANRMQELLAALLSYSRIESKGEEFRPAPLDDVVRDAIADLEVTIQRARAKVSVGPMPTVTGDPSQLRQLFQNLIGNALKYRRTEAPPVIKVHSEEGDGHCLIFVEDNGIGFDEKYLDKIFQPFQRLHGKNEYSGTGIGLAVCRKVAERHGGTVTAKSTPGKGSTFIVTLPVNRYSAKLRSLRRGWLAGQNR
jgi:PAS domain S-box-containing protein